MCRERCLRASEWIELNAKMWISSLGKLFWRFGCEMIWMRFSMNFVGLQCWAPVPPKMGLEVSSHGPKRWLVDRRLKLEKGAGAELSAPWNFLKNSHDHWKLVSANSVIKTTHWRFAHSFMQNYSNLPDDSPQTTSHFKQQHQRTESNYWFEMSPTSFRLPTSLIHLATISINVCLCHTNIPTFELSIEQALMCLSSGF